MVLVLLGRLKILQDTVQMGGDPRKPARDWPTCLSVSVLIGRRVRPEFQGTAGLPVSEEGSRGRENRP